MVGFVALKVLSFGVLLINFQIREGRAITLNDVKSGCGETKGCFFPNQCDPSQNCVQGVTYSKTSDTVITFELFAEARNAGGAYVALGFSKDKSMGDDSVTECVYDGQNSKLYLSHNDGKSTPERLTVPAAEMPKLISGGLTDGFIICKFEHLVASSNDKVFALDQSYNLLVASGAASGSSISNHDFSGKYFPAISEKQLVTQKSSAGSGSSYLSPETKRSLKKAHGICMIFGWFLFVASAILFARYCKKLWPDIKIAGIGIWFQMHRGLNLFGVLLIAIAFILIFVAEQGKWEGPGDFSKLPEDKGSLHSLLGMTASIIAFCQPIISLMRCSPTDAKRPIFNWIHRFLGITAWCIAATTIWIATFFKLGLSMDENGITPRAIIIFYWVSLVVAVIMMEIHAWVTEWCVRKKVDQSFQMQQMNGDGPSSSAYVDTRPKYGIIRTAVLIFFMVIALGVTIALAVLIGLS